MDFVPLTAVHWMPGHDRGVRTTTGTSFPIFPSCIRLHRCIWWAGVECKTFCTCKELHDLQRHELAGVRTLLLGRSLGATIDILGCWLGLVYEIPECRGLQFKSSPGCLPCSNPQTQTLEQNEDAGETEAAAGKVGRKSRRYLKQATRSRGCTSWQDKGW
jgi:hypothetical protein